MIPDTYVVTMFGLDDAVCRRMLARVRFGRVGFVDGDGQPTILPVNCLSAGGEIMFRTAAGSALDQAADGQVVAFETDHIDEVAESGWSLLVRGPMTHLAYPARSSLLSETEVHPWAPGPRDRWILIGARHVTGRIIDRHRLDTDSDHLPRISPD